MVRYRFLCGQIGDLSEDITEPVELWRDDEIIIEVWGDIASCLRDCPDKTIVGDVSNCPFLLKKGITQGNTERKKPRMKSHYEIPPSQRWRKPKGPVTSKKGKK